ncbi:MAG: DUF222 domain-containing protein [Microthrixaceae bacterium]
MGEQADTAQRNGTACLCGGLVVDTPLPGLDVAALDAEIAKLARIDSTVVARRSQVVAELARRRSDPGEALRKAGNMSSRQARKAEKTAKGLSRLPKTREALERGEIGAEAAEQLASRMGTPEAAKRVRDNEAQLLERAKSTGADEFARSLRRDDIAGSPDEGTRQAQRQRRARKASMWIDPDTGMHVLIAQFDPVTGARISTRLAAMVDKLWRAENGLGVRSKRRLDQRRADALETLICRGTPNSTGGTTTTATPDNSVEAGHTGSRSDRRSGPPSSPNAPGDPTQSSDRDAHPAPSSPNPAPAAPPPNSTQLMVIANFDALRKTLNGGSLPDGTQLPADTIRRLACDAEILPAIFDATGQPLWLGRTQRLATPAQRAAVTARDQGCIVCHAAPEFCQVHHIEWWSGGGGTDLDNLCLLCSNHHHAVHERGLTIINTPTGMRVQPRPARDRSFRSVPDPPQDTREGPPDTAHTAA